MKVLDFTLSQQQGDGQEHILVNMLSIKIPKGSSLCSLFGTIKFSIHLFNLRHESEA
jgi:hypothetical protein